jgi:hypothetical protein
MGKFGSLVALAGTAIAVAMFRPQASSRKERYAEITPLLGQILADLTKYECISEISNRNDIEGMCKSITNRVAAVFSIVAGKRCSACIKTLVAVEMQERPRVATLCRDDSSQDREQGVSPLDAWIEEQLDPDTVVHWVDENSAFRAVLENPRTERRCYFSNDLPAESEYTNTSFAIYGYPSDREGRRNLDWPLPYRSTIVAPIGRVDHSGQGFSLVGFLAVDSHFRYVFDRYSDVQLLSGIGAGLHNLVLRYQRLIISEITGDSTGEDHDEGN